MPRTNKPSPAVPVAILLGGALIAVAIYVSMDGPWPPWANAAAHGNPSLVRPVDPADHILGNPGAKAFIVEYCDFSSDYCKGFHETMNELIAMEGADGTVAWAYREFPLKTDGPARDLARAAECAGKVGGNDAFFKFAGELYDNQPVDSKQFGALAEKAGVGSDAFAQCYADAADQVDARISADRQNALAVGAIGTPYSLIVISGRAPIVIDGAYSYDALKQVLDQALGN